MIMIAENFNSSYYAFGNNRLILYITFGYILVRDLAIYLFFIWVEHFNRLILLYYKQEQIHLQEISLLVEKQNFEKIFSRKRLLPHYFFNILEHIYAKSSIKGNDDEHFDKLKFVLYYFLVDAEEEFVELDKEIMFYKHYTELENFRHNYHVCVNFNVFGQTDNCLIIPLLFEPIISNAMKYAKKDDTGYVNIEIDTTRLPKLNLYCKNDFDSFSLNSISSENGLKILKQRLELCYKDKYSLKIFKKDNTYEVFLSIIIGFL
jgi:LytS/YehU family sensor histidine kinase